MVAKLEGRLSRLKLLFVCSRNHWRSPTAERVWANDARVEVRSAGTSAAAQRTLRPTDLAWADLIFAMEDSHAKQIRRLAGNPMPRIVVLDIPDEYRFMDPELIEMLRASVEPIIANYLRDNRA